MAFLLIKPSIGLKLILQQPQILIEPHETQRKL
jgi:hypothetical protein